MTGPANMKGDGVPCPVCYGATRVKDTRPSNSDRHALRRRRKCLACEHRFTTLEILADKLDETQGKIRDRADLLDRYMGLDASGRAAVRNMISSIENAMKRGARYERQAAEQEQDASNALATAAAEIEVRAND